jgi:uncharacterized protein (TIGR02246 family)
MRRVTAMGVAAWGLAVTHALPAPPATGLDAADVRKIDEMLEVASRAAVARDFATWANLFLEDAVINPPNQPAVQGRAAIRAWLETLPPILEFRLEHTKVEGRADLAYTVGTYRMTMAPPGAPGPVTEAGKFVEVLRRQADGRWLCAVDMFSSDSPPGAPPK